MFKTARIKIHNPTRHKRVMLRYALEEYHRVLRDVLERAAADPELREKISSPKRKGELRANKFRAARYLRSITPKKWVLAPLRDYLVGDAAAMLQSHFGKLEKGKHPSNLPTLQPLRAATAEEIEQATAALTQSLEFPLKETELEAIEKEREAKHPRVARRLEKIFGGRAISRATGKLLRSLEVPCPRPLEVTRPELERGFVVARCGSRYFLLLRLFARHSRYWREVRLRDGLVDVRTGEALGGKRFAGVILPLEFSREYFEAEFLKHGRPQSAKLVMRRGEDGEEEFYAHIVFEFTPERVEPKTYMGIDRGSAKIGVATLIDGEGRKLCQEVELEGSAFAAEMRRLEKRIAAAQRRGIRRSPLFRLRKRVADNLLGEFANRVVRVAIQHQSQVVLEKIDAAAMNRFLKQSQFRKLHAMLTYKLERAGLPAPMDVPAAYTSQTCGRCGHSSPENRPKRDEKGRFIQYIFKCVRCGYEENADTNASYIIALWGLHQKQKGVRYQEFSLFQQWLKEVLGRGAQES